MRVGLPTEDYPSTAQTEPVNWLGRSVNLRRVLGPENSPPFGGYVSVIGPKRLTFHHAGFPVRQREDVQRDKTSSGLRTTFGDLAHAGRRSLALLPSTFVPA